MKNVRIYKAADDPICTRVSVGGNDQMEYYCTYRGTPKDSIRALEMALQALKAQKDEPPLDNRHRPIGQPFPN